MKSSICWRFPFLCLYCHFHLIVLMLFFDCTNVFLRLYRCFPSIVLAFSFDFTETSSPQRFYSEPSLSQRRALVIKTASLRQLVESKGTIQSVHKCDSDNPLKGY